MTDKLAIVERQLAVQDFDREKIELIKKTVATNATDVELELFLYTARKVGLDPLAKQIYCIHRKNSKTGKMDMSIQTGIDGYRLVADRTGKYAGNDDYEFDDPEKQPAWAKATVWKMVEGQRCPFSATARWSQYYPGDFQGFMWKKMPHVMLGKCAEALALRKAFPAELSGLYTADEMAQADKGPPSKEELEQGAVAFEQERAAAKPPIDLIDQLKRSVLQETAKSNGWSKEGYFALLAKWNYEGTAEIADRDYEGILEQLKKDGPASLKDAPQVTGKPEPTYDAFVSQEAPKPTLLTLHVTKVTEAKAQGKPHSLDGFDAKQTEWHLTTFHGNLTKLLRAEAVGKECELEVSKTVKGDKVYWNLLGWKRIGTKMNMPDSFELSASDVGFDEE